MEYYLTIEKNEIPFAATWMNLEIITEKTMANHSSTLAWRIPWTEEPGRLQSRGSRRVRHDWGTSLSCIGEGNGNPLQNSCLENPRDGGAWWAAVYGVAQSRTWLKLLSSSSSRDYHTRWSQAYDITYRWNLNYDGKRIYLWNRNRLTGIENRLVVTKRERGCCCC